METNINSIVQELFDTYYDESKGDFTKDLSQEIAKRANGNQEMISKIKNQLELFKVATKSAKKTETSKQLDNLPKETKETGEKVKKLLNNYGIDSEFVNAKIGPRVTQYEFDLAPGVRINQVANLSKDLAMGLGVKQVAVNPIEGGTNLGIQIPNETSTNVSLDDVDNSKDKGVTMSLGKDMNGDPVVGDILDLQHVLIGGSTGSGKSACINSIICSLIKKYGPDIVKLILIDPKKVELTSYNNIPHLLMPIVTDPNKAAEVLEQLCDVMDKRYDVFSKVKVKNIEAYNQLVTKYNEAGNSAKIMPYIICIIDELADLMMTAGKSVESSIQRLTQLSRAAGIHLIVATQRPSVDVVTGTIKNNIASRIAFATPSSIDSKTILDQPGAEKLLGKGDMLYKPIGTSNPKRVQGAFVSDDEVNNIVNSVIDKYGAYGNSKNVSNKKQEEKPKEEIDENYKKAVDYVKQNKKVSTSALQIALHIPFSEATRLINKMRENGIIK